MYDDKLYQMLYMAYLKARKNKRNHKDAYQFELNLFENLHILTRDIQNRSYKPTGGIAFVNFKPVIREIIAAEFKDRVVQHVAFSPVYQWWDRRLHPYSCSCRKNKGTDYAIHSLYKMMQSVSDNFTKETYFCKFDFQGYFMSIDRQILYDKVIWGLRRQFPRDSWDYKLQQFLWQTIIFDDVVKHVRKRGSAKEWAMVPKSKSLFHQPPGVGLPIGNVTSQMGSNIMLDSFDRFVSMTLGYKRYIRYVDDWIVVVNREQKDRLIHQDLARIEEFATSQHLTLHPKKRYIQPIERGVEFLGAIVRPHRILAGKRTVTNFKQSARDFMMGKADETQLQSYLGRLKGFKGANLEKHVFEELGWDYPF